MGRTGKGFAFQNFDMQPDIITLAKAVAGGFPMGVMLARQEIADCFVPGDHASTFGGTPLACAAGLAASEILLDEAFLVQVQEKGAYFRSQLSALQAKYPDKIAEVRGLGLMIGCELKVENGPVLAKLLAQKVLVNGIGQHVLRFVPPLIITQAEMDEAIAALDKALADV